MWVWTQTRYGMWRSGLHLFRENSFNDSSVFLTSTVNSSTTSAKLPCHYMLSPLLLSSGPHRLRRNFFVWRNILHLLKFWSYLIPSFSVWWKWMPVMWEWELFFLSRWKETVSYIPVPSSPVSYILPRGNYDSGNRSSGCQSGYLGVETLAWGA